MKPDSRRWWWAAYFLVGGAAVVAFFAIVAFQQLCLDGTHRSCLEGQGASDALVGQLVAGPVALVFAMLTAIGIARRAYGLAKASVLLTLVSALVWAELMSAATG